MLYNIIGDIHGREIWKTLIKKDAVNIFVGDYLDPYIDISFEQCLQNFQDIITLKQLNPQSIILLLGNHDLHYFDVGEHYSRYDYDNALTIRSFLCDNIHWFHGIAYSIDNKILVSHAGVTLTWLVRHGFSADEEITPDNVAQHINNLFFSDYMGTYYWNSLENFLFDSCCDPGDFIGDSAGAPPTWVRPATLIENNVFANTDYVQVVGHTQMPNIHKVDNVYFIDCLGKMPLNSKLPRSLMIADGKFANI